MNQNHTIRRFADDYINKSQDPPNSNSSFYSVSYSDADSLYTNSSTMPQQKPTIPSYSSNTRGLSQRTFLKRGETRARKISVQNSSDFYYYSDKSNPDCDSSSYLPSYKSSFVKTRGKIGNTVSTKQRLSRSFISSSYHKTNVSGIRTFLNNRDGANNRRIPSRTSNGGANAASNGRRQHLLSFILELLTRRQSCLEWVNKTDQVFQIINPDQLTQLWGEYKNNKRMTFESLSRSLRYSQLVLLIE